MLNRKLFVALLPLLGWLALATRAADAREEPRQTPMTPISGGALPFTETLREIEARSRAEEDAWHASGRPPVLRAIENEFAEKAEEELQEARRRRARRGAEAPIFLAPPYGGPANGSFLPGRTGKRAADGGGGREGGPLPNPPQSEVGFAGPSLQTQANEFGVGNIPPDTRGEVGPNHLMILVNGHASIYQKASPFTRLSSVTLDSFFALTVSGTNYPRNGSFDPRLVYDRRSGRWFATAMEFGSSSGNPTNNHILLAVSRTSDPTGTWDKYLLTVGVTGDFTDYSTLGIDDNGVYIAARYFPRSSGNQNRAKLFALPKASLIATPPSLGATYAVDNVTDMWSTPQPAVNLDGSGGGRAWFVSSSTTAFGNVNYRTVTWSGGVPSISASASALSTPSYANLGPDAPSSGAALAADTGDDRLKMAMLRGNRLWAARNIGVDSSGAGVTADRCAAEWLEISVANAVPTLVQSGRVFDSAPSSPRHYFYPGVAVNGQGHAALGFSGSRSTEFISAYTCGRLASDPLNTMQAILQTKIGEQSYSVTFGGSSNRWGDYSYLSVDPADDQTIWSFQEYAGTKSGATSTWGGNWVIRVSRLRGPAPTLTGGSVSALPGQTNASFKVTGANLFDPGAGFSSRLSASASGSGIANVRVSYLSPTSAAVFFDVDSGAASGTRNLTLTNPDGQSATLANAITIVPGSVQIAISRALAKVGGNYQVTFTVRNNGSATATNVRLTASTLGSANTTTGLPVSLGTIAAGGSAAMTLTYPGSTGASGSVSVSRVRGDYTGGTFSNSLKVTLP